MIAKSYNFLVNVRVVISVLGMKAGRIAYTHLSSSDSGNLILSAWHVTTLPEVLLEDDSVGPKNRSVIMNSKATVPSKYMQSV